jgi:hypothetical protein
MGDSASGLYQQGGDIALNIQNNNTCDQKGGDFFV